jgi:hypothetical protein
LFLFGVREGRVALFVVNEYLFQAQHAKTHHPEFFHEWLKLMPLAFSMQM